MSLLDAPEYDPARERRKKLLATGVVLLVLVLMAAGYRFRNWPEERVVDLLFAALQAKDYETAYGVWLADPEWKQHADRYKDYTYADFYGDWGPGGEWGLIRTYRIEGSVTPANGTGIIVEVTVNDRAQKARVWVEKKDKTLTFPPI
jgi:hypothetical protein